jgi:hypothetical protein
MSGSARDNSLRIAAVSEPAVQRSSDGQREANLQEANGEWRSAARAGLDRARAVSRTHGECDVRTKTSFIGLAVLLLALGAGSSPKPPVVPLFKLGYVKAIGI